MEWDCYCITLVCQGSSNAVLIGENSVMFLYTFDPKSRVAIVIDVPCSIATNGLLSNGCWITIAKPKITFELRQPLLGNGCYM